MNFKTSKTMKRITILLTATFLSIIFIGCEKQTYYKGCETVDIIYYEGQFEKTTNDNWGEWNKGMYEDYKEEAQQTREMLNEDRVKLQNGDMTAQEFEDKWGKKDRLYKVRDCKKIEKY